MNKISVLVGLATGFFMYYIGAPYAINHGFVDDIGANNIWYIAAPTFIVMFVAAQYKPIFIILEWIFKSLRFIFSIKTLLRVFIFVSSVMLAIEYLIPFIIGTFEIPREDHGAVAVICIIIALMFSLFMKTIFKLFAMAFKGFILIWNSKKILGAIFGIKKKKPKEKSVKVPTLEIVKREYQGEEMPAEFYIMQLDHNLRNIIQFNQIGNQSADQITSETHL